MNQHAPMFVLASASPRRKQLLEQLDLEPVLWPADIDESVHASESPRRYVERMSSSKLCTAWRRFIESGRINASKSLVMLASDTSVIIDNKILGKPENRADFYVMMNRLSGNEHTVITGVSVGSRPALEGDVCDSSGHEADTLPERQAHILVETRVRFKVLSDREMDRYWATGEPQDKAGGYGIQGKGAVFVEAIEGSYSNVVGLPLKETAELLAAQGLDIWACS